MKSTKTLGEFIDKIERDEITVFYFVHNSITGIDIKKYFIKSLKEMTEENFEFIGVAQKVFRRFKSSYGYIIPLHINLHCWDCGEHLKIMPIDEKNIALVSEQMFWEYGEQTGRKDYFNYSISKKEFLSDKCQKFFQCGITGRNVTKDKYTNEIDVPSGELFFTNYFNNDEIYAAPKDKRHSNEYNINHLLGRLNLMEYLASKNVGYGQMGNMDIAVFLKDTKDQIIIYEPNNRNDSVFKIEGYKRIGKIDCSVWRWMCADKEVLNKYEEPTEGCVKANVIPGKWIVEHYFGLPSSKEKYYSKLYLKR